MSLLPTAGAGLVSNPGLPMTAAMHYGRTMVLYTAQEKVECVVDGAPPGPNGRLFIVEVNDPTEVPWEAGRFILEHLAYTGVVKVDEMEVRNDKGKKTGTEYDLDKAHAESLTVGLQYDQMRWQRYISDLMDDYVSRRDGKTKAVPEPPPSMQRLMVRRGYKLVDFGIKTVGYEDPATVANQRMKDENQELRETIAALGKRLAALESNGDTEEETEQPRGKKGNRR